MGEETKSSHLQVPQSERRLTTAEKIDDYKETEHIRAVYLIFRDYEKHENDLLNQRVTWLVTMQAVTMATFGFSIQKQYELAEKIREMWGTVFVPPEIAPYQTRFYALFIILAIVGLLSGFNARRGIKAAKVAQEQLRERWKHYHRADAERLYLPNIAGGGDPLAEKHGSTFAMSIPVFFMVLWGLVLTYIAVRAVSCAIPWFSEVCALPF